jgi:hypothetical protein
MTLIRNIILKKIDLKIDVSFITKYSIDKNHDTDENVLFCSCLLKFYSHLMCYSSIGRHFRWSFESSKYFKTVNFKLKNFDGICSIKHSKVVLNDFT